MSALNVKIKQPAAKYTLDELRGMMRVVARQVMREEIKSVHVDSRGYLVFPNEAEYADYLKKQPDKLPSEVKAYFINPEGFKIHYSDYELTPKKARELEKRKNEPTVPHEVVRQRLRRLGVKV